MQEQNEVQFGEIIINFEETQQVGVEVVVVILGIGNHLDEQMLEVQMIGEYQMLML
jgi:hypothetical protein